MLITAGVNLNLFGELSVNTHTEHEIFLSVTSFCMRPSDWSKKLDCRTLQKPAISPIQRYQNSQPAIDYSAGEKFVRLYHLT
jgi:hypothetical protein